MILQIVGLVLCAAAAGSLYCGMRVDRASGGLVGGVGFIVLWYAGFFCLAAGS